MTLDDLAASMHAHETAGDRGAPPGAWIVARLDGRGFTGLLQRRHDLDRPFDLRIRDIMIATADHLMHCGLEVVYGHTQSDEISLLLAPVAGVRPLRPIIAALAGEASAKFTHLFGEVARFDCRLAELPDLEGALAYLAWRQQVGRREALHAYLAAAGAAGVAIADDPRAQLVALGVDVEALPDWHRGGAGLLWASTGVAVAALRRRLRVELELPTGAAYTALVRAQVQAEPT